MNSPKNVRSLARILALGLIVSASGVAQAQTEGDPTANSIKPVVGILNPGPGPVGLPLRVQVKVFSPLNQTVSSVTVSYTGPTSGTLTLVKSPNYPGTNTASGVWQEVFTSARLNVGGTYTLRASATNGASQTVQSAPVVVTVNANKGDGNLLVRDNGDQFCSDCHLHKTHSSEATGAKYGSWYVGCRTCHTPHNTPNASLISPQINPPDVTATATALPAKQVVFSNRRGFSATGGAGSASAGTYANGDETGVCQVCHTRTEYYRYDGNDYPAPAYTAVPSGNHYPSQPGGCGSCHKHDIGMKASCNTCHGSAANAAPPVVAPATVVFVPGGGVHQQHVAQTTYHEHSVACAQCHATSDTTHPSGQTTVTWGSDATDSGAVTPTPSGNLTAGWTSSPTCTNYCHGATLANGFATTKVDASWISGATPMTCTACHGAPPATADHGPGDTVCGGCHDAAYTLAAGGAVNKTLHINNIIEASGCTGCHGTPGVGAYPPAVASPVPTGAVTSVPGGAHTAHLNDTTYRSAPIACDDCHFGFVSTAPTHKNTFVNLAYSPFASTGVAPTPSGQLLPGFSTTPSCTNYCHGATIGGSSPLWTANYAVVTCQQCHSSPPVIASNHPQNNACDACHYASPGNTGYSFTGLSITQQARDSHINAVTEKPANGCRACHGTLSATYAAPSDLAAAPGYTAGVSVDSKGNTTVASRGVGLHAAHLTQTNFRQAIIGCTECHAGAAMPTDLNVSHANGTVALAAGPLTLDNTLGTAGPPQALTFNGTTCANTYCHGNFAGGRNATPNWLADVTLDCNSCHGSGTGAPNPPPPPHMARTDCASCHPDYTIAANRGSHINGQLDYVTGGLDCNTCHGGNLTPGASAIANVPNDVNGQNLVNAAPPKDAAGLASSTQVGAHDQHVNQGAAAPAMSNAYSCVLCHGAMPTTYTVSGNHRNGSPNVPFTGFALATGANFNNTTHQCASTYCHGNFQGGLVASIGWGNGTDAKLLCNACHLMPPVPKTTAMVSYHPNNTNCGTCHTGATYVSATAGTVPAATHADGSVTANTATGCARCHGQIANAVAYGVNAAPGPSAAHIDSRGNPGTLTTAVGVGKHAKHVSTATVSSQFGCGECHSATITGTTHADGALDLPWGTIARTGSVTPTYATNNCTNYCHGNFAGGRNASVSWVSGTMDCTSCHLNPPIPKAADTTPVSYHPNNTITACSVCHGAGYTRTGATTGTVVASTHVNGTMQKPANGCTACHGDLAGVGGAATLANNPAASPGFTAGTGIDSKGNTAVTARGVGAHRAHVVQTNFSNNTIACTECHFGAMPVDGNVTHANGTVGMGGGPLATDTSFGTTPTLTWNGTQCSNTYCHGNFTGGNGTAGITWAQDITLTCTSCHGNPPLATHSAGDTDCNSCHTGYTNSTVDKATHINGELEGGSCNGCHGNKGAARTPVTVNADPGLENAPPTAADKVTTATTADQVGAHISHVNQITLRQDPLLCSDCHPATLPASHKTNPVATITWGSLATTGLTPTTPTYTRGSGCASTYCHGNFTNGNDQVGGAPTVAPGVPGALTFTAVGTDTITVNWGAATNATLYKVERGTALAGPYVQVGTSSTTSFVNGGLTAGTTYWYRVRAWNVIGESAYNTALSQATSAAGGTPTAQTYDWQWTISGTYGGMTANLPNLPCGDATYPTQTAARVTTMSTTPNTCTMRLYTSVGGTANTPLLTIVLSAPYATNMGISAGSVVWTQRAAAATTVGVQLGYVQSGAFTGFGTPVNVGLTATTVTAATTSLASQTGTVPSGASLALRYTRVTTDTNIVRFYFSATEGITNVTETPPAAPNPPAPTGTPVLTMGAVTSTSAAMSWTASTNATSYIVERGAGATPATWAQVGQPTGTSLTDQALTASTLYSYRVRGTNLNGSTPNSTARQVTTAAATAGNVTSWTGTFTPGSSTMTCSSCHGNPPGGTHPPGAVCNVCHTTYPASGVDKAIHMDGNIDKPTDCTACHAGDAGSRRPIVSEFSMTWSHKRSAGGTVTKWDCIVCHMEGDPATGLPLDGTTHQNSRINLRDPDTGLEITNVTFTGNIGGNTAGSYGPAAGNPVITDFSRNLGVALESDPQKAQLQAIQQNQCLKCHDGNGATAFLLSNPNAGGAQGTLYPMRAQGGTRTAEKPFATTISYAGIAANIGGTATAPSGALTANSVAGGVINVAASFATTNSSYHPVAGRNNNSYTYGSRMAVPFNSGVTGRTAGTPNVNVYGLLMSCWDCHALTTDSGTITKSVTAHGGAETVRGVTTVPAPASAASSTNAVTFCQKCHLGYQAATTSNISHGAGSAVGGTNALDRSEKVPYLNYACNLCHSSGYGTAVVRPVRAQDVHGVNALPTTGVAMTGRWNGAVAGADARPYAFIRNRQFLSDHRPKQIGAWNGTTGGCDMTNSAGATPTACDGQGWKTFAVSGNGGVF